MGKPKIIKSAKRVIHYTIDSCIQCPYCKSDVNLTSKHCTKLGIFLFFDDFDEDKKPIPDLCPLKKST